MRESLRRELLSQKVIEREVGSKVAATDQEITDFFNANKAAFNIAELNRVAQIVTGSASRRSRIGAKTMRPHRRRRPPKRRC